MIYLLEDDDSIRKLVVYALESQGYEAAGFSRPSEFRAAMRQRLPELVLMDIMLPEEDGISVLTRLRAEPETRGLPVIMLTAKNSEYDRAFGLDAGADDYISKPFGMMELLARVRAVLRRTAPQSAETEFRVGTLCVSPGKRFGGDRRAEGHHAVLQIRYLLIQGGLLRIQGDLAEDQLVVVFRIDLGRLTFLLVGAGDGNVLVLILVYYLLIIHSINYHDL